MDDAAGVTGKIRQQRSFNDRCAFPHASGAGFREVAFALSSSHPGSKAKVADDPGTTPGMLSLRLRLHDPRRPRACT